ncbi:serine hydrolase [Microlunatus soli]|uniref:Beta-lactamase class A n=1 Tax=Microlunatus soli TaxID=630515 RepID=A0A1H1UDK5_9ACTN|nr:serine hydrolase [Microlunatus soli]SDS69989.1 beta-lactamase class A [Microlunatus soli]
MVLPTDDGLQQEFTRRLDVLLAAADVRGWVHAVDLDSGASLEAGADQPVVAASVFKLPVLVELFRQIGVGRLDARQRVRIGADERRTVGPTGLSVMLDDVELSLRDLGYAMMSVSDNRATDVIVDLVGLDAINNTQAELGFPATVLEGDCQFLFDQMDAELGESYAAYRAPADGTDRRFGLSVFDPLRTNRTTPRSTTALLAMLWRDEILDPSACAEIRRILSLQVWPHRLTSGFPDDEISVAGKTGTIGPVRNEVGVVSYPDGGRYAVAVFLRQREIRYHNPVADAAIGQVGRLAIDHLRADPAQRTDRPAHTVTAIAES